MDLEPEERRRQYDESHVLVPRWAMVLIIFQVFLSLGLLAFGITVSIQRGADEALQTDKLKDLVRAAEDQAATNEDLLKEIKQTDRHSGKRFGRFARQNERLHRKILVSTNGGIEVVEIPTFTTTTVVRREANGREPPPDPGHGKPGKRKGHKKR